MGRCVVILLSEVCSFNFLEAFLPLSHNADMLGFSVFLCASLIDFGTAVTTVCPQSKIQWRNDPAFFLSSMWICAVESLPLGLSNFWIIFPAQGKMYECTTSTDQKFMIERVIVDLDCTLSCLFYNVSLWGKMLFVLQGNWKQGCVAPSYSDLSHIHTQTMTLNPKEPKESVA